MNFLQEALKNLPQAAQSPYAFVAYLGVIIAWIIVALRVKRNGQLMDKIQNLPEAQRRDVILAEMDKPIPPNLTPEQWLRARRQMLFFYGFIVLCVVGVIIFVIAATYKNQNVPTPAQKAKEEQAQDNFTEVKGNVYDDQTKKALAFANVTVVGQSIERTTDSKGFFSFEVDPKINEITIHFEKKGFDIERKTITPNSAFPLQIFLKPEIVKTPPKTSEKVTPKTSLRITGNVYDDKTKNALPFARITVVGTTISETTDDSGLFILKGLTEKGIITLNVSKDGYISIPRKVDLQENVGPIEIYLTPQE